MPSYHTVQLAIKYAGKLHRLQLADKLGEVASAKMEEEMEKAAKSQHVEEDDLQMYSWFVEVLFWVDCLNLLKAEMKVEVLFII